MNSVNPAYLTFDYTNNEYTFVVQHMCYVSSDTVGTNVFHYYTGGAFDVFSDPIATGTAGRTTAPNPPNASHLTWEDGENVLGGDFTSDIVIWVDLATGNGSISGNLDFSRGTQLGNIPVGQRSMSLFIAGIVYHAPGGPGGIHLAARRPGVRPGSHGLWRRPRGAASSSWEGGRPHEPSISQRVFP